MTPDSEALRAILKQYIGPAYDRALRNTGDKAIALDVTRRAMELLKRSYESGVEPNKALVLRITDDCCNQSAFYNKQAEVPGEVAPTESQEATNNGEAAYDTPDLHSPISTQEVAICPSPAEDTANKHTDSDSQPKSASNLASNCQDLAPTPALDDKPRKAKKRRRGPSPGIALLIILLSLMVIAFVILLVVMLSSRGVLPGAEAGIVSDFSSWFNAHIFPLF